MRSNADVLELLPGQRLRLSGKTTSIKNPGLPLRIEMGRQTLDLYPDRRLTGGAEPATPDLLLLDPARGFDAVAQQSWLRVGDEFETDSDSAEQARLFTHRREAFRRHLQCVHEGDVLSFRDTISELGTYLSLVDDPIDLSVLRRQALSWITEAYGGSLRPLSPERALALIQAVNRQLAEDTLRGRDSDDTPGGLLQLPADLRPVLLGDLHGQVDNLLTILSRNAYLRELQSGTAALVLLGDAVHSDRPGELERMDGSMLVMDLLFTLMKALPGRIVFLLGNHDSFSPEIMKGGVAQGMAWERFLTEQRGADYAAEVARFYRLSPVVAMSDGLLACHAGPPGSKVSQDDLVNVHHQPRLLHDLTWSRLKTPGFPAGYGRRDVLRFRKSMDLSPDTPFIVGHYPLSADGTVWTDIGHIEGHHLLYGSAESNVAVIAAVDDVLTPQVYPVEPLLSWVNEHVSAEPGVTVELDQDLPEPP